ncbi:MAG: U32 family peptidase [Deltaproteobacteria bacterium]|nr:MAG: U32 family peptidase [Deltaproteobacteria bacterium]
MSSGSSLLLELVLTVASPRELADTDLSPYDGVCLGNTYCRRIEENFAEDLALLPGAVASLHAAGKKVYVTSPAAPRGRDMSQVERLIDAAAKAGADAFEVHNMGVLRVLRERGNPLPAHMGAFANVYTHLTAKVMRDYGAVRVRPNAEVSLAEMVVIGRDAEVEVEVLAHGKIPLGITEKCFFLEGPEGEDPRCPAACGEAHWLTAGSGKSGAGAWTLKNVGKGILSGKDMCVIEHLPRLLSEGFCIFRVEGLYETAAYRSEVGAVYREAFSLAATGKEYAVRSDLLQTLRKHSRNGFCNGYYFGGSGHSYVGTVLQGDNSRV